MLIPTLNTIVSIASVFVSVFTEQAAGQGYSRIEARADGGCAILYPPGTDGPYVSTTWPCGVVPYTFAANVTSAMQEAMLGAMSEIEGTSSVRFVPRTSQANYVQISDSVINSSYVGMIGGSQIINIFNWNYRFIMCHELIHALGYWHTQQRSDRDNFIQINYQNVCQNCCGGESCNYNFDAIALPVNGPYDFDSVMHYGQFAFSSNGQPTITVLPPNQSWQNLIGQLTHLSSGDISDINFLYPCRYVWNTLGSGFSHPSGVTVWALTVYNGELIAGGEFSSAGGQSTSGIARWNGTTWQSLGSGVGGSFPIVRGFTIYDNDLIACGGFATAGGVTANRVARWNGSIWAPLGTGMNGGGAFAMAVYDGNLFVGGNFTMAGGAPANYIAQWNGTAWQPVGSGMNGIVDALTVYNGSLIAGGRFTTAGGQSANRVARWNGANWAPLGSGMDFHVFALKQYNGDLIAGGGFTTAGGQAANHIARWNGSTWSPLGSGTNNDEALSLAIHNGDLIAAGSFTTAGGQNAKYLARWDGTSWFSVGGGANTTVLAVAVYNDQLIAAGQFTSAGCTSANYVVRGHNTCVAVPPNDTCADAILVPAGSTNFSTIGATTDGPDETPCGSIESDVWFKYFAECTGHATVSLCGANYDTRLAAYASCADGMAMACDDDACGVASQVLFPTTANTVYRIRIGGANGASGSGTMTIVCIAEPLCPGDINQDDTVNVNDLLAVINSWGPCASPCPPKCAADVTDDCSVNVNDLLAVINAWGACP